MWHVYNKKRMLKKDCANKSKCQDDLPEARSNLFVLVSVWGKNEKPRERIP